MKMLHIAGGSNDDDIDGGSGSGNVNTFCATTAPRRMFLCDVPLFIKQTNSANGDDNVNFVRLMGTVIEIIQSPQLSTDTDSENNSSLGIHHSTLQSTVQTPPNANELNSTHPPTRVVHFVIDDGTGSIGVFSKRRVGKNNSDCNDGSTSGNALPSTMTNPLLSQNTTMQPFRTASNRPLAATALALESILSSPPPPILVGQTVDCIGRIQVNDNNITTNNEKMPPSSHKIWLAASSVSIVNNPQSVTLRQMELSSSKRLSPTHCNDGRGDDTPQNRILLGGDLERKLNPLFHCNHQNSVVFNMEDAFNYIKHSKDDGGITQQELALLVGAVHPNEMLAVNLAVEQLREDCRIYLNQGKWFPM